MFADNLLFEAVPILRLIWPSLALLVGGLLAPRLIPRFGTFKEIVETTKTARRKVITIEKYNGELRRFAACSDDNGAVQAFHKAQLIEQRMETELEDLVRTCVFWVAAHLCILLMVAGSLDKATHDSSDAEHIAFLKGLTLLLSTPFAEILVIVFCFLSLQRLSKEWRDIREAFSR